MANMQLPSAPVREFIIGGRLYVGANPQYTEMPADPGNPLSPMIWVKTAKGVPFRRAGKLMD